MMETQQGRKRKGNETQSDGKAKGRKKKGEAIMRIRKEGKLKLKEY